MKRLKSTSSSALGPEARLRMPPATFKALAQHLRQDPRLEQLAFGLCREAQTADGTVYLLRQLLIPEPRDLATQGVAAVAPKKEFLSLVYLLAEQTGSSILHIHTHPHQHIPTLSPIDQRAGTENAHYVRDRFREHATLLKLVFDPTVTAHDGVVFDRSLEGFRTLGDLEIHGRGGAVRRTGEALPARDDDPRFDRQIRIPGWDQTNLRRQRVAIVGVGGLGSTLFQTLVGMGAGQDGWITVVDSDHLDQSNVPRIPYATSEDVGHPKVNLALRYAAQKNPGLRVYAYPCSLAEKAPQDRLKAATAIILAVDNDGARRLADELAVRYQIPLIDLGCEVIPGEKTEAGGQVRVVLPGQSACLTCCGGYDAASAARSLAPRSDRLAVARAGYIRGVDAAPTPSVANLSGIIAQFGVSAFLILVHGPAFGTWDYLHFNQLTAETMTARSERRPDCPLCGPDGCLAEGDQLELPAENQEPDWGQPVAAENEPDELMDTVAVSEGDSRDD